MEPDGPETTFLLTEFLASLEEVGLRPTARDHWRLRQVLAGEGRWTRSKLRTVLAALLAKNREEQALITARFDNFFDFSPGQEETPFPRPDVRRALAELASLPHVSIQDPEGGGEGEVAVPPKPPPKHPLWLVPVVAALLTAAVLSLTPLVLEWWGPKLDRPVIPEVKTPPPPWTRVPRTSEAQRQYESIPKIGDLVPLTTPSPIWSDLLTAALVLLGLGLGYGSYIWQSHRIQEPERFPYDPHDSARFNPGALGGTPEPWIGDDTLDLAAESLDYLETETFGRLLDQEATVEVTSVRAGLPSLVYQYRRELQTALILEDLHAPPRAWNPTAGELVEGLAKRGVPAIHGRFAGSPEIFSGRDDEVTRLLDLEDGNRHLLVLLFTDGKGLDPEGVRVLKEAAGWPAVAWMDLREPRFWEEGGRRPVRHGIPIFPATDEGVRQVFAYFLSSVRDGEGGNVLGSGRRRLPPRLSVHRDIRAQTEEIAGDALAWAQACSMVQPITMGLTDALRKRFFPLLPPERIGRLFALPGTRHTVAGLRFSGAVLTILRSGFQVFRSSSEQEEILRFLLDQIDEVRPRNRNSLAALTWEVLRERVHLELEPDLALERLARLATTPLGPTIRGELRDVVLPGEGTIPGEGGRPSIPLRCAPKSFEGRQHLARLAPASGLPVRRFRPLQRWEGMIAGLLGLSFLITGSLGLARSMEPLSPKPLLKIGSNQGGIWIRIGDLNGKWRKERRLGTPGVFEEFTEDLSGGFRLAALRDGVLVIPSSKLFKGNSRRASLFLEGTNGFLQCTDRYDDVGLILERCPPGTLPLRETFNRRGWRESLGSPPPENRLLSVGLEIEGDPAREEELRPLRKALLETGSVDFIYRVDFTRKGAQTGTEEIVRQLEPWTDRAQLIWWWVPPAEGDNGDAAVTQVMETLSRHFATVLRLDRGTDLVWASRVRDLLTSGPASRVSGSQLQAFLDEHKKPPRLEADVLLLRVPTPTPPPEITVGISFIAQSEKLTENASEELSKVALQLKQDPNLVAEIKGYADPREKERDAQLLSEVRAKAIQSFLVTRHNIAPSLITIEGRNATRLQDEQGSGQGERRLARVLISMHSPNSTADVRPEESHAAISSTNSLVDPPVEGSTTSTVPVTIRLHGLIALVPTDNNNHMTALLLDARQSPSGDGFSCFSPYRPMIRMLTSSTVECVEAGCVVSGNSCTCDLSRQEITIQPHVEPPGQKLPRRPKNSLPSDEKEAGDFSYIANLAQPPLNMELDPRFLAPTPPSSLAARMEIPFESVTACSIVKSESGDGIQAMSFRRSGAPEQAKEISQALAESAVFKFMVPENETVRLSIHDFGNANTKLISLMPGSAGYTIELSNERNDLERDTPCADGVGRDFALFYELARYPPPWADRLIPHVKYTPRREHFGTFEAPGCRFPGFTMRARPMRPMASFYP